MGSSRRNFPLFGSHVKIRFRQKGAVSNCSSDTGIWWSECRDSLPFRFAERKELPPSSWRQATVHRTVALNHSNLNKQEKDQNNKSCSGLFGPSVELRTRGLLNPIQARYQTSPHPDILFFVCRSLGDFDILPHTFEKCKCFFQNF